MKLVECKHLSIDKVDLATVLTFYARISDIQKNRGDDTFVDGNLYTTVGYTAPAKAFADAYGIATNSAHLDKDQGTISFAEGVVVRLATHQLKLSAGKANIIT